MNEHDIEVGRKIIEGSERTIMRGDIKELLSLVKELREAEPDSPQFQDWLETLYTFYDLISDRSSYQ